MPPTTRSKIKEIKETPRKGNKKQISLKKGGNNQELEKQKLQKKNLEKQELGKLVQKGKSRKHEVQKQESEKNIPESQKLEIPEPDRKRSKRIELRKTEQQKDQVLLKQQAGTLKKQRRVLQEQGIQKEKLQKPKIQTSWSQKELSENHETERKKSPRVVLSKLELQTKVQNTLELKSQRIALKNQKNRKEELPTLRVQNNGTTQKQKSLKLAEQKQNSSNLDTSDKENHNLDIYEFTFDPNEEPPPPKKKKRNRAVKKKPTKQKPVVFKNFYESNISKALNRLKSIVKKPAPTQVIADECNTIQVNHAPISKLNIAQTPISKIDDNVNKIATTNDSLKETPKNIVPTVKAVQQNIPQNGPNRLNFVSSTPIQPSHNQDATKETMPKPSNVSVRVEDIAADFDPITNDDIDYSPINSPIHVENPIIDSSTCVQAPENTAKQSRDPLNLQDDISFFNNPPVANSSIIKSTRGHLASPWRVEFQNLPIKWNINSYVKADMTPAIESSFVNFDENNKKHVYTNLVPQTDEVLPQLIENSTPQLKQTSIISFIKEVIEKSEKKKRGRSVSPTKANFDETYNTVGNNYENTAHKTPNKTLTPRREVLHDLKTPDKDSSQENAPHSTEIGLNENSRSSRKHKTITVSNTITKKTLTKKDDTYFGFNDSEYQEQENISPIKNINAQKVRALRPRLRAVLKQINAITGPSRSVLPVAVKSKFAPSSEAVNKLYEEMKSAADAPVFPEKDAAMQNIETTNVDNHSSQQDTNDDDSQSVHLFEDIEPIHHFKPHRKSYGKPKRVAFQRQINFDSDTQDSDIVIQHPEMEESSDEDHLEDLTFKVPKERSKRTKKKKKETKKQKLTKKEEKEADVWAAGFNSMCEDIDQFTLIVE